MEHVSDERSTNRWHFGFYMAMMKAEYAEKRFDDKCDLPRGTTWGGTCEARHGDKDGGALSDPLRSFYRALTYRQASASDG